MVSPLFVAAPPILLNEVKEQTRCVGTVGIVQGNEAMRRILLRQVAAFLRQPEQPR